MVVPRKLVFAMVLSALVCAGRTDASGVAANSRPPNVLFIVVDDLNDWVGHLGGNPDVQTPHIDRLASLGVSFTNAHSPAVSCKPSRAAVLSGLRPSTTGIYSNAHATLDSLDGVLTLPRHFREHGYRVIAGGKILHSMASEDYSEDFDEYFKRPPPQVRAEEAYSGKGKLDWLALDSDDEEMPDHKVVSWALERLEENWQEPTFLAVGIVKPHLPWYVPEKYFALYPRDEITLPHVREDDLDDIPPLGMRLAGAEKEHKWIRESDSWRDAVRAYLAAVSFVDRQVGRLVEGLQKSGKAENTVVVLWSDHGLHLGEKKHWKKASLWEESTRTPLVFVAPGVSKRGGESARPVDALSIYPTLAELCGLPIPEHVEGASLKALVEEPAAPWDGVALTTQRRGAHAVRSERWRYIRYADGSDELYDHEGDPMEWRNLADVPEFEEVKNNLARWMPDREAPAAVASRSIRSRTLIVGAGPSQAARIGSRERVRLFLDDHLMEFSLGLEIADITDPSRPLYWHRRGWRSTATRLAVGKEARTGRMGLSLDVGVPPNSHRRFRVEAFADTDGQGVRKVAAREFTVDTGPPEVAIDTPGSAVFGDRVWISGTARDNSCLAAVELEISDENEGRTHYWNGERWQPSHARVSAALDRTESEATGWRYQLVAPLEDERRLGVKALAADCAGNGSSVATALWSHAPSVGSEFELRATEEGYVVDTEAPAVAVATPHSAVFGRKITLVGEARDDLCVAGVSLLISADRGGRYWDGEGWRGTPIRVKAELERRGAPATGWRYSFEPPFEVERRFRVTAQAKDCARNGGSGSGLLWSYAAGSGSGFDQMATEDGHAVDTEEPSLEIRTPSAAIFGDEIQIAGQAHDDLCVAEVSLLILAGRPPRYWNGDRWQNAPVSVRAELERRGSGATGWRYSFGPAFEGERRFRVRAQAKDCARNTGGDKRAFWSYAPARAIAGSAGFGVDTERPEVEITSPSSLELGRTIEVAGEARDDLCVADVELTISADSRFWDGERWRDSPNRVKAVLDSPGARSSGWRYDSGPTVEDGRRFTVRAFARDCTSSSGRDTRRLTMRRRPASQG